ncbi:YbaB/EbfC family nucleoid-associated protein [Amycolatopsis sp. NPDC004169]|uniref:YbaB/EbfC family nucleoid-associated protein n=1 Tax=Amycolatopsis sp. NPDC004169 TaxID=3154453 RepID=UPI0033A5721E
MTDTAQLIEEMRWQLRQIEDRKAENRRLLAGSGQTTVVSPDRTVTVLAGPDGVVNEVRLAPEALRSDADTLSRAITAAIREAAGGKPGAPPAAEPHPPVDDDDPYDTVFDV